MPRTAAAREGGRFMPLPATRETPPEQPQAATRAQPLQPRPAQPPLATRELPTPRPHQPVEILVTPPPTPPLPALLHRATRERQATQGQPRPTVGRLLQATPEQMARALPQPPAVLVRPARRTAPRRVNQARPETRATPRPIPRPRGRH